MRVTTFGGFEIYTQKCMTLRDFDNFLFFPWIRWFLHATVFAKKWCKTKWSCFYINARAFVILKAFCVKKQYFSSFLCFVFRLIRPWKYLLLNFHNVYICFPIDISTKPLSCVMKNSGVRELSLGPTFRTRDFHWARKGMN